MKRVRLLIDCGTTNLRVTLVDEKMNVLGCKKASGGVRNTAIDGHDGRLKSLLKETIDCVLNGNGLTHENVLKCAAYGMITSNMGLCEIAHLPAPVSAKRLADAVIEKEFKDIAPFPISFIPGVKSFSEAVTPENFSGMDMMRGEETEAIGLYSLLKPDGNSIFVLPGSHNKFVYVNEDGEITGSMTTVSGELLDAVTKHTILADSAESVFADEKEYMTEAVTAGARECAASGIGKALFGGRILSTLGKKEAAFIRSYLLGAVFASDIEALDSFMKKMGRAKIYIAGKTVFKRALYDCMNAMTDWVICAVSKDLSDRMGIEGAKVIAFRTQGI